MAAFDLVYASQRWTSQGNGSGPGSDYNNCRAMCDELTKFIAEQKIQRIVDVSCGGMAWWPHIFQALDYRIEFHGFDASSLAIKANVAKFHGQPSLRFQTADARIYPFPKSDLLICRQTLNHLWREDCTEVLQNLRSREHRFLAITHNSGVARNLEDEERLPLMPPRRDATCYTPINLTLSPYSMPRPAREIPDVEGGVLAIFAVA